MTPALRNLNEARRLASDVTISATGLNGYITATSDADADGDLNLNDLGSARIIAYSIFAGIITIMML